MQRSQLGVKVVARLDQRFLIVRLQNLELSCNVCECCGIQLYNSEQPESSVAVQNQNNIEWISKSFVGRSIIDALCQHATATDAAPRRVGNVCDAAHRRPAGWLALFLNLSQRHQFRSSELSGFESEALLRKVNDKQSSSPGFRSSDPCAEAVTLETIRAQRCLLSRHL